ncbi:DUF2285 domain-containing protein [Agrobacterium tumefaciens]|nr:DUF2285 domain-containing protein [Agrobacterium tumefaciens]
MIEVPPDLRDDDGDQPVESWRQERATEDGHGSFRLSLSTGERLQIADNIVEAGIASVAAIPLGIEGFDRIEAVYRLLSALHGRAIPPDTRLTRQQRVRQRRMLRAFDGYRAGATQQEIAEVIFSIDRLDRDEWQTSEVRHKIKTLLRDAKAMIAGGYRKLLRHRHRP